METVSAVFPLVRSNNQRQSLMDPGYLCAHWGRWDSYSALRKAASICETCRVLRDWFRLRFSARFEEGIGDMDQLDDRICAQFPLAGNLSRQTGAIRLRPLDSNPHDAKAAVIEVRSRNATMECTVILKRSASVFGPGRSMKISRLSFT